jgi:hypothetical protein
VLATGDDRPPDFRTCVLSGLDLRLGGGRRQALQLVIPESVKDTIGDHQLREPAQDVVPGRGAVQEWDPLRSVNEVEQPGLVCRPQQIHGRRIRRSAHRLEDATDPMLAAQPPTGLALGSS